MMQATYEQVLIMLDRGIIGKLSKNSKIKEFGFGFRGGKYLGAPGKDVYFILSLLDDDKSDYLAARIAEAYPKKAPNNHLKWAACIRYIYGCFEKQGCLRSKDDKKRMIEENPDWQVPITFMNKIAKQFKTSRNTYGLVLHYEMLAHRYGDYAIINNDNSHLNKMARYYEKSQKLSLKCKSWKHTWTPFYWAGHYFYEIGDSENAIKYHKLSLKFMEKYCPDSRPGYREKARASIKHLKKLMPEGDWKKTRKWLKKCKNKCLRKVKKYV